MSLFIPCRPEGLLGVLALYLAVPKKTKRDKYEAFTYERGRDVGTACHGGLWWLVDVCANVSEQEYCALCDKEGRDCGGSKDELASLIFDVSLANGCEFYSKKKNNPCFRTVSNLENQCPIPYFTFAFCHLEA